MKIVDVSVALREGMVIYPGDAPFQLRPHSRIADGAGSNNSVILMGSHTGTHVDAPHHMLDGQSTVERLPLDHLVGPCRVVDLPDVEAIGAAELDPVDLHGAERVLFRTRNSRHWGDDRFYEDFTALTGDGAARLVRAGVKLVGVDYLSVDRRHSGNHPAHMELMHAGVTIVEGLDLSQAEPGDYLLVVAPLKIVGCDGAPARVFLLQED